MNRQAVIDRLTHTFNLEGYHPKTSLRLAAVAVDRLERDGYISFDKDDISATNILPR